MIPQRAPRGAVAPPPFTFLFAALLTLLTSLLYTLVVITFAGLSPGSFSPLHAIAMALAFSNAFAMAARRFPQPLRASLALVPPPRSGWIVPFLLLSALLLVSELDNCLVGLFPALAAAFSEPESPPLYELALGLLAFAVVQPIAGETFFRGLVQGRLAGFWTGAQAVIATTLLSWSFSALTFAMLTLPGPAPILRRSVDWLGEALLLGILRQSSGSLYPPLLLAALFGAVRALTDRRALGIPGFDDLSAPHTPAAWLVPAALLSAAGLWLCHRMVRGVEREV